MANTYYLYMNVYRCVGIDCQRFYPEQKRFRSIFQSRNVYEEGMMMLYVISITITLYMTFYIYIYIPFICFKILNQK